MSIHIDDSPPSPLINSVTVFFSSLRFASRYQYHGGVVEAEIAWLMSRNMMTNTVYKWGDNIFNYHDVTGSKFQNGGGGGGYPNTEYTEVCAFSGKH